MTSNLLAALKSNQGKTSPPLVAPLIEAAKAGSVSLCAKALEEPKVKVDQKDPEGISALMHAAQGGNLQVVSFLVEKGARIAAKDDTGETALMKACKDGHVDIVQYLMNAQVMQRRKIAGPLTLIGDVEMTIANEKRRVLDMKDDEGVNALMKAAEQGESDVVRLLLDEGASPDAKDDEGWNVLMWAALQGHEDICEMLVREPEYELAADFCTEKGETALMKAAANGHWGVCQLLLEEGAGVNQVDCESQSALMWAAAEGHRQAVKGLLETRDAKVDLVSRTGKTALLLAAQFGREEICKLLMQGRRRCGVETAQDAEGTTALFGAVQAGSHALLEALIEQRCDVELHTHRGGAALEQLQCVEVLLAAGAKVHQQDENGQTALDHAEGTLNSSIVDVLRQASGAQPESPR
ncbi:unnamed protein product [Prorocentrum cordatum]|uniref:Uncharacterized protein n=1 Tax=Prorocentrum cordatum TaxID=2364126 RepID=A0ABN9Q7C8_9DINO|nr:unnamed protein product [Polarella glacialis]